MTTFPRWICGECGYPFDRRWTAERHLKNKHGGNGEIVNFMEYNTGVRIGRYGPPTYTDAKFQPKPIDTKKSFLDAFKYPEPAAKKSDGGSLKHSFVSKEHIVIGYRDIQDLSWSEKLRKRLEQKLKDKESPWTFDKRVLVDYDSFAIEYFGYVCPKCLAIGISSSEKIAEESNEGHHQHDRNVMFDPPNLNDESRQQILDQLERELGTLLYTFVNTIIDGRECKLAVWVGRLKYSKFIHVTSSWDNRAQIGGSIVLTKEELRHFLSRNLATAGYANRQDFVPINMCLTARKSY